MHRNQSKKYFNRPGLNKMMVGDFEVTVLSDGPYLLDMNKLLFNAKLGEIDRLLKRGDLIRP